MNFDMISTKFVVSEKEQALKNKFFRQQVPQAQANPQTKPTLEIDQKYNNFMDEMQITLKQQATGAITGDLLQKQALIMQQQVEILKSNQMDYKKIIQQITQRPKHDISKQVLAEIIEPLSRQMQEVKSLYQETHHTNQALSNQIKELKNNLEIEDFIEEDESVKIAEKLVDNGKSIKRSLDLPNTESRKSGKIVTSQPKMKEQTPNISQKEVMIKNELQIVNKEIEMIESEIDGRLDRILQKVEKIKNIPQNQSKMDVSKILGELDYGNFLEELDALKSVRNQLINDYKSSTPNYPKSTRNDHLKEKQEVSKKQIPIKTKQKVTKQSMTTKKINSKPKSLQNILTKPITVENSRIIKLATPKDDSILLVKTQKIKQDSKESFTSEKSIEIVPEYIPLVQTLPAPETSNFQGQTSPRNFCETIIIAHENPLPFQTRPGSTTGKNLENSLDNYVSKNYIPKQVETNNAPRGTIEEKTIDVVTMYILNQTLGTDSKLTINLHQNPRSLLGVDELSELVKQGLHFDPNTISRIGKEIITEKIREIRSQKEYIKEYSSDFEQDSKDMKEYTNENIEEESKREDAVKEKSEEYTSDFEPEEKSPSPKMKQNLMSSPSITDEFMQPFLLKSNVKIENSPRIADNQNSGENSERPSLQSQDDISALFNPRLLGMMSAASIQHYVSSLIRSGHLSRVHQSPSFLSRTQTPSTQIFQNVTRNNQLTPQDISTVPQSVQRASKSPILPDEITDFLNSNIGQQFQNLIKENSNLNSQQIMQKWANQHISSQPILPSFNVIKNTPNRINVDLEQRILSNESRFPRRYFDLNLFEESPGINSDLFTLSESEESLLSSLELDKTPINPPEFLAGFREFLNKAQQKETSLTSSLSEGEIKMSDVDPLSSGEIPNKKFKDNLSAIFSQTDHL